MNRNKNIAVIGLGYVGLPLAVEFGKVRPTLGFDIDSNRIEELNAGLDRTKEVSKSDLGSSSYLRLTNSSADLSGCQVFIITVPTPIDYAKRPNLTPLLQASELVGCNLKVGDIVIFESTVFPGCTEDECVPVLERSSGLKFNEDFYCGYSPERINPGDRVNTLTTIRKVTSGSTPAVALEVDQLYGSIIKAGTYSASSIKVAEAAKVIENTQRDLNIALVNELSVIFERLEIDTLEVLEAAGSKWNFLPFRPGLVGGHCIGVDPYYLTHKAEQVGYNPQVILSGRRINDNMSRYAAKKSIQRMVRLGVDVSKCTIGILGITFKDDCPDTRNSKVFDLIEEFESWGIKCLVSDPWCNPSEVHQKYGIKIAELDDRFLVDALVVAVGHSQFREFKAQFLRRLCRGDRPFIADLKSLYERAALEDAGFEVFRL